MNAEDDRPEEAPVPVVLTKEEHQKFRKDIFWGILYNQALWIAIGFFIGLLIIVKDCSQAEQSKNWSSREKSVKKANRSKSRSSGEKSVKKASIFLPEDEWEKEWNKGF